MDHPAEVASNTERVAAQYRAGNPFITGQVLEETRVAAIAAYLQAKRPCQAQRLHIAIDEIEECMQFM